jgi:hypothetical protein
MADQFYEDTDCVQDYFTAYDSRSLHSSEYQTELLRYRMMTGGNTPSSTAPIKGSILDELFPPKSVSIGTERRKCIPMDEPDSPHQPPIWLNPPAEPSQIKPMFRMGFVTITPDSIDKGALEWILYSQGRRRGIKNIKTKELPTGKGTRRTLPQDKIKILQDWFDQHKQSPYPSSEDKDELERITQLTRQVRINIIYLPCV